MSKVQNLFYTQTLIDIFPEFPGTGAFISHGMITAES